MTTLLGFTQYINWYKGLESCLSRTDPSLFLFISSHWRSHQKSKFCSIQLAYLNHRERQIYLVSRLQELRYFLDYIINHPLCGLSEEVRIFFTENRDDFLREKMQIDNSISEMNVIGISMWIQKIALKKCSRFSKEESHGFQEAQKIISTQVKLTSQWSAR